MDVTSAFKITSQQLSHATRHYHQRTRKTVISHTSFRPCKTVVSRPTEIWSGFRIREKSQIFTDITRRYKSLVNKIKKYIRKVSAGFVKCNEWRVASLACNRPTLDRRIRAAGGLCCPHCLYDVTTIPASVCVVSLIKVLLSCSHVSTASCDTLWHDTNAILLPPLDRAPPPPVCLSASQRSPSPKQSKLYDRAWHHDKR